MPDRAPPIPPQLAREAVRVALEWHALRLWERLGGADIVGFRIPDEPEPIFASVMGEGGEEFGVVCYRGEAGIAQFRTILRGGDEALEWRCDMLSMTMDRPGLVPPEQRRIVAAAGCSARVVPHFLVKAAGRDEMHEASKRELRAILCILRAFLVAEERGLLEPIALAISGRQRVLMLTVRGEGAAMDVLAKYETFGAAAVEERVEPVELPDDLRALPRTNERLAVGFRPAGRLVANETQQTWLLLVADCDLERPIHLEPLLGGDVRSAALVLAEILRTKSDARGPGLPASLAFANQALHDALAPGLLACGVACTSEPGLALLDRLWDDAASFLRARDERGEIPGRDDRAGWRAAEERLGLRIREHKAARTFPHATTKARYFGAAVELGRFDAIATTAYFEWCLTELRARSDAPTLAEALLQAELTPAERMLLTSRLAAPIGIYRVESIHDGTLALLDVISGRRAEVYDVRLASSAREGLCVPGRPCVTGDSAFLSVLGPPLMPLVVDAALDFLEHEGLELTPEGIARAPHLLGRLWIWCEERASRPVQMQNTDGDPLRLQTVTFSVRDPKALRRELARKPDVEPGESDDEWIWFRAKCEQRTLLARLSCIGDELLMEVNSDERAANARRWLVRIPGVEFVRVRAAEPGAIPRDDRLRAGTNKPLDPETLAAVREHLHALQMKWLDEPIPALGGLTPRAASKTPAGRAKVERMIRTMPDVSGGVPIPAPRAEMLRELGMEEL